MSDQKNSKTGFVNPSGAQRRMPKLPTGNKLMKAGNDLTVVVPVVGTGALAAAEEMCQCTAEQILKERNKRLMSWMAEVLDLNGEDKRQFYSEMSVLILNVTDGELAEIICEKLSPKMLLANIDDAKQMIQHFYDIAADWHFNTPGNPRN